MSKKPTVTLYSYILCSISIKNTLNQLSILLTFAFITTNSFAQQKPGYNLLWRISGKGIKNPSYLFGTMHVKDKRAFDFSDSVMVSIQKCSAFALEIQPDTMIKAVFAKIEKQDTSFTIKKIMSPEDYAGLAKRFMAKNGYSIDEANPMNVESLLQHESKKPDDKITFVDAYLYGIARTLDKNIFGLENASDQVDKMYDSKEGLKDRLKEILAVDDSTENSYEEQMIKIYNSGNVDAIYDFVKNSPIMDDALIARNKVMCGSIIAHLATQNIFTAVGVAHLPGESGVIALLRKEGYTLTPENATFTGLADKFKVDYFKMKWETYTDKENGYSMETPGLADKTTAQNGLKIVTYPDMANDIYYGSYAIIKAVDAKASINNNVVQEIVDNYRVSAKYTILSQKKFLQDGFMVTDVSMKTKTGYLRIQLRFINNILYCLYIGNKLTDLDQPYAERFFKSFKRFEPKVKKQEPWVNYENPIGAFKIQVPVQPEPMVRETPDPNHKDGAPFVINMFIANDKVNLGAYIIRYNDYPAGNYLGNKNALFDALTSEFSAKGKVLSGPNKITYAGYEGRDFKLMLADKYYTEVRLIIRGNRIYFLLKENLTENATAPLKDDFLNSLVFLPYQAPKYYDFKPEDANFKIKLATKPLSNKDTVVDYSSYLQNSVTNFSTNPSSGGVYGIEYAQISKYYRIKSIDTLYTKLIKRVVGYKDTLLKIDTVDFNGIKGRKFLVRNKTDLSTQLKGILIVNGYIYFLTTHLAPEEQNNEVTQTFFSSLSTKPIDKQSDNYASKAQLIATDLSSRDTTIFKAAKGAIAYYNFEKNELPIIYKTLQNQYPDDTLEQGVRPKLVEVLKKTNDAQTVSQLQEVFNNSNGSDILKSNAMTAITEVDPKNGYDIYFKMLTTTKPLKLEYTYQLFRPLTDSIPYAAAHFRELIPLLNNTNYRNNILILSQSMLYDSNKGKYVELIKNNFDNLTRYANADIDQYLAKKDSTSNNWYGPVYHYLNLMTKIKGQPITDTYTAKIIKQDPKGSLISDAAIARIKNHLPTSQLVLNRLMDSIDTRYDVMKALYQEKQLLKIPLKFKNQAEFAKLCFYQFTDDDDDHPNKITLLGTITNNGMLYYTFKFGLPNREDTSKRYLGITGPYVPGTAKLDFSGYNAYTVFEEKKINWQLQSKKMIPDLNKQHLASIADN